MRLEQGFTLVELMVAMVVGSIAIASAYASYDVIAKQYEKVKGVTAMQSSSRSIMRMIERDIRMAGFKWRDSKGTITFGSISEPIKITDSGNKCCDAVTVTYDYRDEASKKVERHKIHYTVSPYQGRNRLYRKRDILFPKARAGNNDVLADYVEDLQIVNIVDDMNVYSGYDRGGSTIQIHDPTTNKLVGRITQTGRVAAIAVGPNGLVYSGYDRGGSTIQIHDPTTNKLVGRITQTGRVAAIAVGPNGLVYSGYDRGGSTIQIHDPTTNKLVGRITQTGRVAAIALKSKRTGQESLVTIDLILRTKKEFGFAQPYKKKDYYEGNYDINKNDAYKRQEYSSTVLIRNPL